MTYTTAKPRELTPDESALLRTIIAAGWWSVDARCQTFEDQENLEFLWRHGYIERKAYGGWGAKATMQAKPPQPVTAETVRALLLAHGITPVGKVLPCKTAIAWSANCWAFVLPRGVKLGAAWDCFERVVTDQNMFIVELKG